MKKMISVVAAGLLALSLTACNTPQDRAVGGALVGGAAGTAIGAAATRNVGGAVAGGLIGAAGGALIGGATAPADPYGCPYGTYQDRYGNIYCR